MATRRQCTPVTNTAPADTSRGQVEELHVEQARGQLRLSPDGIALLHARLREANTGNPKFDEQLQRLMEVLQTILLRVASSHGDDIDQVLAAGDWVVEGIDLRGLPYDEVMLHVVLRAGEQTFALHRQIAEDVFTDLGDDDILVQFRLETLSEWERTESRARAAGREAMFGITLLSR